MTFKLYGYAKNGTELLELAITSLCFSDPADVAEFEQFISACKKGLQSDPTWDHEHYFDSDNETQIVLAKLDSTKA